MMEHTHTPYKAAELGYGSELRLAQRICSLSKLSAQGQVLGTPGVQRMAT